MKEKTESKDEMGRILSNPDNLIVSDSLVGRLDFGDHSTPMHEISATLSTGDRYILGRFKSYEINAEKEADEIMISFTAQEDQLENLLSIKISDSGKMQILENEIAGSLSGICISRQNTELLVSVTITRLK